MKGLWSTLGLVAVATGLGAYIYFVDSTRSDVETKEKVFTVAADDVEELRITAKDDTTVLRKTGGEWRLVEPVATEADQSQVSSLLTTLTSLDINREVDPKAADLTEYGIGTPKADITFTAKGGVSGRVRLGDQTPTGGDFYAVKGDDPRVFLVSTFVETSLARSTFDLRDKRLLRFERDKADGLEITTSAGTTAMTRANAEWRLTAPANARGDYGAIEGLLTRLTTTSMQAIETSDISDLKKYGLDTPAATLVVKTGSSAATLQISAEKDAKVYGRDLARPMIFTIDATTSTDLKKAGEEYRKKDLFDFRAFTAKSLIVTRGTDTVTFTKVAGTGENPTDKWTIAGGGTTRDAEAAKMDDLLTKLTNLRAESFAAAAPAGAMPLLTVTAQFDEGKKDEASVTRVGADAFATRADEAGAMKMAVPLVEDAIKALDAALAPPPPPTPATPPAASATGTPPEKQQ